MVDDDALRPVKGAANTCQGVAKKTDLKPDYGTLVANSYALSGRRAAPAGKFRLLGVDTFDGPASDFLVGDFNDKAEAIAEAAKRAGPMLRMHVFDDQGQHVCDR